MTGYLLSALTAVMLMVCSGTLAIVAVIAVCEVRDAHRRGLERVRRGSR